MDRAARSDGARHPAPHSAAPRGKYGRIAILTYGSRGDVEPFVALGAGLRSAGHAVRLAAPAPFASLVRAHGLAFQPIEGNPDQLVQAFADRAGLSWPRMVMEMAGHVLPLARAAFRALERATSDADLIIHSFLMTDAGHTLAQQRGVPDLSAQFFPVFLSTLAFPAVAFPDLPLGGQYRRATHLLSTAVFRYTSRFLYRRVRASAPSLPDLAPWPFARRRARGTPVLLAYSEHLLSRPPDWPAYAHVTGYWQLAPPPDWTPPDDLVRFLARGSPPVYFGIGSVRTERLRDLVRIAVASARACEQRLFLDVSPGVAAEEVMGPDVFVMEDVPHAWLFPRMRYVLHHGGAGTTGAAASTGIPNTAIPFSADQGFWARQIYRRGLGPSGTPARRLNRRRLEAMLRELLANPAYRSRSEALARRIRREDGVVSALRIVEACLGKAQRLG